MNREFWEEPEDYISPSNPEAMPSGTQNPYLTLFARIDFSLNGLAEELSELSGVEVAPFNSYHLTVKSIGEVSDSEVRDVVSSVSEVVMETPSFEVTLDGVGAFPNCLHIPVTDSRELVEFHRELCNIPQIRVGEYEGDEYVPHVTIAKFSSRDINWGAVHNIVSQYVDTCWATPTIEQVYLVKDSPGSTPEFFPSFQSITDFELQSES